ncbi:Fe(II)-2OG oxygenase family protein [Nocardia salmonicida]|uniref:hypothetical protein n=1 Tax=Nocardia salmonicida TaxID=53431 RepID=UPI0007A4A213|nr:hypothetical protein [Nocardia salmonicida]
MSETLTLDRRTLTTLAATTADLAPADRAEFLGAAADRLAGHDIAEFTRALTTTLTEHSVCTVTGFEPRHRLPVTALIAAALGGVKSTWIGPLGGEITTVQTKAVLDHNLEWHTDSTSWTVPNRWQILTLLTPDRLGRPAPTGLLRWSDIITRLPADAVRRLSTRQYSWRAQFPALPALSAPILGTANRWLIPALDPHRTWDAPTDLDLYELETTIKSAPGAVQVELTASHILVFDNHRMLHRGPSLNPDGGRTLVRVKVGGHVEL